ncbi:hypothetical protein, partial [Hafnia sp.]
WLHSLTRITYSCKLIGIRSFAALLCFQLIRGGKRRWLHSLTRITYSCKLIGIRSFAALLCFQLIRGER